MTREPTRSPYANFKDPFGLALRMLFHRSPIARWALLETGLRMGLYPVDKLLGWRESHRRNRVPNVRRHPLLLVVGAPRSGSTLASQLLADQLDVTYLPNLCNVFPNAPLTATQWVARRIDGGRHIGFTSFYGNTSGLAGMSDGFCVWNRWLGQDRYRVSPLLTAEQRDAMRTFFDAWTTHFDKPFLNKNNRNVDAIELLANTLENACIVIVSRDPFFVAQSLLQAREFIQGSVANGWGLFSADVSGTASEVAPVESVCQQVLKIDARIHEQLTRLDERRYLVIDYATMCHSPQQVVKDVCRQFTGLRLRSASRLDRLQPFRAADQVRLRPNEADLVRERLRPYYERNASRVTG